MTTEFELTMNGSSKNLLDSIAMLADQGINLDTVATSMVDGHYVIKFIASSEEGVRETFAKANLPFKERRVVVVEVRDRPGRWLEAAHLLVDSGIGLESSYLLGRRGDTLVFVFAVDNYDRAKKVASQVTECTME